MRLALFFTLWVLDIIWTSIMSRIMRNHPGVERIRDGGLAALALGAAIAFVGFFSLELEVDFGSWGIVYMLIFALPLGAVGLSCVKIGEAVENGGKAGDAKGD
jgi:hypothetical protein